MKTNELRLNNYFKYGDKTFTVLGILKDTILASGNLCKNDFSIENIEPIILTEEWLLKFGFEKLGVSDYFYISSQNMNLKVSPDLKIIAWYSLQLHGVVIKHVHQLQNLYFALIGDELEIK